MFIICFMYIRKTKKVTICAKTQGGRTLYHRSTTKAEKLQKEIYQALGLSTQILRAKKISV